MNEITKVSDITYTDVAEYLRLPEVTSSDEALLNSLIGIAKDFIRKYTGQTNLDAFQDFVIVVLVLCQDMYDTRTMYVDSTNLNYVVDSILGMHSVNLLPQRESE